MAAEMIKDLFINNFRSHKKTKVSFSSGLNIIIGESDTGKTALFDALLWVILNLPAGDNFRSHWGGDTKVAANFDDGKVWRIKTNTRNYYKMLGEKYKIDKRAVPKDISALINMAAINIQRHTEPVFILNKSAPEKARYLNQVVDLEIIDRSLSSVESERSKLHGILKFEEKRLKEINAELKSFKWIPKAEGELKTLEVLWSDIKRTSLHLKRMVKITDSISDLRIKQVGFKKILKAKNKIKSLLKMKEEIISLNKNINQLRTITARLQKSYADKEYWQEAEKKVRSKLKKHMPDICPLCEQEIE